MAKYLYYALLALAVIIGAYVFNISGAATYGAQASVNITQTLSLNIVQNTTDFGTGHVEAGYSWAQITSEPSKVHWVNESAFSPSPIIIENAGNVNANITIKADKDANGFIGGSSPAQHYKAGEGEVGACTGTLQSDYTELLNTSYTNVCSSLSYEDDADQLKIYVNLTIPSDASTGTKVNGITIQAQSV